MTRRKQIKRIFRWHAYLPIVDVLQQRIARFNRWYRISDFYLKKKQPSIILTDFIVIKTSYVHNIVFGHEWSEIAFKIGTSSSKNTFMSVEALFLIILHYENNIGELIFDSLLVKSFKILLERLILKLKRK